ncbi:MULTISPECIES: glutamine synthetase family protein [Frankia]|uniref:Glutamine synthetase (Glutamate--ammonia ligase) n=1 Tax=Frankia alni (strain DSM 45986 / CECT 9034 / ACN14a) TaxID=326424 RepID=Q0RSV2_FRAAA|nr:MULTISPECIES: glutamine synthetase family protein [Frankia]CAJ59352.1 Glutamine synthetase (Glutamate--ammonia ligase) [Frankia alni ACN14a]
MSDPAWDRAALRISANGGRERDRLAAAARHAATNLEVRGVVCVACTFVDNSGITRMKGVPVGRLDRAVVWGVGASPVFDAFGADDGITTGRVAGGALGGPVGDLRLHPDLDRLTALAAQPGWAWAPADRRDQSGAPHPQDTRQLVRVEAARLAARGLRVAMAFEIEWAVAPAGADGFTPAAGGPAYGMTRVAELGDYLRDVVAALTEEGLVVEQIHPEYAAGQFEVSVAAQDPLAAADTCVLVKETVRAVSGRHGLRASFAPKVLADGVGNGGHVHLSLWGDGDGDDGSGVGGSGVGGSGDDGGAGGDSAARPGGYLGGYGAGPGTAAGGVVVGGSSAGGGWHGGGRVNLMGGGNGPGGLTATGEAFAAGILARLPALMALGAPSVASYLRLVPSQWASAYACWGLENREAALRMIPGPPAAGGRAANLEIKCFDLAANPYLVAAGLLAAGHAGLDGAARLPPPVDVDPASLDPAERARRGIARLPTDLGVAVAAFAADDVLRRACGPALHDTVATVRRAEIDRFADADAATVVAATRWRY